MEILLHKSNYYKVEKDPTEIVNNTKPADHLANERTFLAWVRTSIALMGFGFVIVKFSLFVKEISIILGDKNIVEDNGHSGAIGVIMVILGAITTSLAYVRYLRIERRLSQNLYFPTKWLSALVTLCILIACAFLIFYLLPTI